MSEDKKTTTKEEPQIYNVGIVGGGPGCVAILDMIRNDVMKHFPVKVRGVCDINPNAPGMIAAKKMGIEIITTDFHDLFNIGDLNMIIEVTGDKSVRNAIYTDKPADIEFIDHVGARLLWDIYEANLERINTELEAQKRIDAEKNRIKQIFNSLLDEILVINTDMLIQDMNDTFLRNNELKETEVIGKYCYEVENKLKGECQITEDYCPLQEVIKTKAAKKKIYKHMDKTGREIYAASTMTPILDGRGGVIGVIEATRDITDRIQLEEELVASKIRLEKFVESAPFFISIKNPAGQYIQINKKGCEALGRTFEDIIAKTDLEILPRPIAETIRKNDHEVLKSRKETITEEIIELEGVSRYYHATRFPIFDQKNELTALCTIAQDITELKEAQTKLQKKQHELEDTKEYLQNILETSTDIILTTDLDHKIVSFNRGAEIITGYQREELIGKHVTILYENPKEHKQLMADLRKEENVANYETHFTCKDGHLVDVSVTISKLMDNHGKPIGTVDICRDISTRKRLQEQLIRTDRLVAIGKLGAGVAHEINNPLAIIGEAVGWAQELLAKEETAAKLQNFDEFQKSLFTIQKQATRCKEITHRLLGFASQTDTKLEHVNINTVMDEVMNFMINVTKLANIKVHKEYSSDIPLADLNVVQLQQVFVNIIDNAVDSIEKNGNIFIKTYIENGSLVVSIADDGKGIPPELLDKIFDPFVTTKPVGEGTGLGLSICYGIVKQLGGNISVESSLNKGTSFKITFPIRKRVK
ncbi:MAG: PAS domain S-box protein [bacterium]